ncbi:MAG: sigma factor-like helix-turn-helix DNA-binding protein [Candidatus Thorarchaeota archaeon]|nr:sigma factor-like helix-turn-helix DNA-binding protein [Candidatus Thorarchaeota archaeon]
MSEDDTSKKILENLLIVERLLAFLVTKDLELQKDKVLTLSELGMANAEIATVLGVTPGSVRGTLSQAKK